MAASLYKAQVAVRLCEDHDKKELIAYCKTCEKKICSSCIKEDHYTHYWETITDILREKRRTLPEECKHMRVKKLPGLKKEIDHFDQTIQREDATLEKNKSVLNSSRQSYIDKINKLFDDRIDECQKKSEATKQIYRDKLDRLKEKVALDKDTNTLPDHDILDMEKEMRDELENASSNSADTYTCTTVFVPGKMDVHTLENMIGEIHNVSLEVKNEIDHFDRYSGIITSIKPVSDTNAWIRLGSDKYAKLLDMTGKELKTMKTPCVDLIISGTGELVLTDPNEHIISVLNEDEDNIRTIDTKPLRPTYISKTENDDILVTLVDDRDRFPLVPTSRRIVQRITLLGKVLHTYEFIEDSKTRLFTYPTRTAENKNKDICVINWHDNGNGELVVLNKDRRVKFIYRGVELENEKFLPVDTECDDKCRILLTEFYSRSIRMLSANGIYFCTLCQYELLHPYTISIQGDNLWCGFYEGRMKVIKCIVYHDDLRSN